ncbi:MAG: hypothetical protein IT310_04825 [Anaerolineales bacterium]|nr:hypothetical protein [Anaerolineales bacterium]
MCKQKRRLAFQYFLVALLIPACLSKASTATPATAVSLSSLHRLSYNKNFGDGYLARIPAEGLSDSPTEETIEILATAWLEHFKAQPPNAGYKILDYRIEDINLLEIPEESLYASVAQVRFSIIPATAPNQWASLSGEPIKPADTWWYFTEFFGITKVNGIFNLFLLSAQV